MEITTRTLAFLNTAGLNAQIFSAVDSNPSDVNVEEGLEVYRSGGYDGVVGFGGGSALDIAKVLALMVKQTQPLWDFEDVGDNWLRANAEHHHQFNITREKNNISPKNVACYRYLRSGVDGRYATISYRRHGARCLCALC